MGKEWKKYMKPRKIWKREIIADREDVKQNCWEVRHSILMKTEAIYRSSVSER